MSRRSADARGSGDSTLPRIGLLGLLAVAPFLIGAVHPWAYSLLALAAAFLVTPVLLARSSRPALAAVPKAPLWFLLALALIAGLQLVPLPAALARRLVPERAAETAAFDLPAASLTAAADPELHRAFPADRPIRLSYAADFTREELTRILLYAAVLVLAAATIEHRRHLRLLALTLCASGGLVALVGLASHRLAPERIYGQLIFPSALIYGPYVNRNHFAGFLELTLPIALGLAISAARELRRTPERALAALIGAGAAASVIAVALVDCSSRGGLIGAATGLVALTALLALNPATRRPAKLLVAGGLTVAAAALLLDAGGYFEHVTRSNIRELSVRNRFEVWRGTLRLIRAHPLAGVGLGAFETAFPRFNPDPSFFFQHPEDDYLQLTAEAGLASVLGLALLAVAGSRSVVAHVRRALAPQARSTGASERFILWAAAVAGLASLLVHGAIDVNLHIPANATLFFALAGVAGRRPQDGFEPDPDPRPRLLHVAAGLALVVLTAHLGRVIAADFLVQRATQLRRAGGAAEPARALLARAVALDPIRAEPREALGESLADLVLESERPGAAADARVSFEHLAGACATRPADAILAFELGWLSALWGHQAPDPSPALILWGEHLMRHAVSLYPRFGDLHVRLGLALALTRPSLLEEALGELRQGFSLELSAQERLLPVAGAILPPGLLSRAVPETPENRLRFAVYLDEHGLPELAIAQYQRALQLATPAGAAGRPYRQRIAERLNQSSRYAQAEPVWQELADSAPASEAVEDLRGLGGALTGLGRHAEARQVLARALALHPSPELYLDLGWAAYRDGDCAAAADAARAVLASRESNPGALYITGLCQERRGDLGLARDTLRRLARLEPSWTQVGEQIQDIERRMAAAASSSGK